MTLAALTILSAAAVGFVLGYTDDRVRLLHRIGLLGALILRPRHTVHVWRHRHDPPPPRSPAVRINEPRIPDHRVNEEG